MVIEQVDADFWRLIAPTILDEDTRNELLAKLGSESGVLLLIHFKDKIDNIANELSTSYADTIIKQMDELESVGLSSARVSEFNLFKTTGSTTYVNSYPTKCRARTSPSPIS